MIQNPIRRVLSTLSSHGVRYLLMGGQACIFYGAAEFSRDTDIAILGEAENLAKLRAALTELDAERIAVPELDLGFLRRGHAVHFRCREESVAGIRLDIMSVMRGVDSFTVLWERRSTVQTPDGEAVDLLALPDLVAAKKTQRDKDWPMIRRLVEAHYTQFESSPTAERVGFWLREARTPDLLITLSDRYGEETGRAARSRPLLEHALKGDADALERALEDEARTERLRDREYWAPLVKELEDLRHAETRARHAARRDVEQP